MGERISRGARRRVAGVAAVEFALILTTVVAFVATVGEFFRIVLVDQALARATYAAARAAGARSANCDAEIDASFQTAGVTRWLLDRNGDGRVAVIQGASGWPDGSAAQEVQVNVRWDDDLSDGSTLPGSSGCGGPGSWISVRSRIVVHPWSGLAGLVFAGGVHREHESWARNQSG